MSDAPVEIVPYDPSWPQRFAVEHRLDREAYTLAKRPFIDEVTATALRHCSA